MLAVLQEAVFAGSWSFGVTASPAVSRPQTGITLPYPNHRFSYSLGIAGAYDLSADFFCRGALQYSRKSILVATGVPDTRNSFDSTTGRIDLSRVVYGDASEAYESVSIPLSINYRIAIGQRIDLITLGGIECGLLFRRTMILEPTTTGTSQHSESESGFIFALTIGAGVGYSASGDVTVLLLPAYSYSLYPHRDFSNLSFHTVSVECAVLYRF